MLDDGEAQTSRNVLPVDPDVLVPVAPGMFMVEAQSVEQLVLNGSMIQTTIDRQRHHLRTPVSANGGPASTV